MNTLTRILRNIYNTNLLAILLVIFLFAIYFSPYFILGKKSYIPVHDNLNQINMLGIFEGRMSAEILPQNVNQHFTLCGTDAIFHLAHPKLDKLLFSLDFFVGYIFNEIFYRLFAMFGFFSLLKLLPGFSKQNQFLNLLLSLAFATLPFWPPGNISIAGLPLLIVVGYNLFKERFLTLSYLFILFYAFYSNFFFIGVFNSIAITIFIGYSLLNKRVSFYFIFGFMLYLLTSGLSHFPLILNEFMLKIPTNRVAQTIQGYGLWDSIKLVITNFLLSHKLSHSLHSLIIMPSATVISFLIWKKDKIFFRKIIPIWLGLIVIAILYGLFYWQPMMNFFNLLHLGFRFDRLYIFNPLLWFTLFSITLFWLNRSVKFGKQIVVILIILQLGINYYSYTSKAFRGHPTIAEFTSQEQFERIKAAIGKGKLTRVGCIGFFPVVANYNGLMTAGSFSSYYPLAFKEDFRKIIEPELDQSEDLQNYFDDKGSALFLFDNKIGFAYKNQDLVKKIDSIICDLNLKELKKLHVNILLSTVKIANAESKGLASIEYERRKDDYYRMFIYELAGG